ncbi:MAG: tetratricopeptide repeat protein [bacterium ADurb.Bin425]|nr:MAG: tetratricopeptide repeat protein [bacterium ADurb.Bin425]
MSINRSKANPFPKSTPSLIGSILGINLGSCLALSLALSLALNIVSNPALALPLDLALAAPVAGQTATETMTVPDKGTDTGTDKDTDREAGTDSAEAAQTAETKEEVMKLVRSNSRLKRWLEKDKRIFVNTISGGRFEVVLAQKSDPLTYFYIMGRYQEQTGPQGTADSSRNISKNSSKTGKEKLFEAVKKEGLSLLRDSDRNTLLLDEYGKEPPDPYLVKVSDDSNSFFPLLVEGKPSQALKLLRKLNEKQDLQGTMLVNLAMLEAKAGDLKKAIDIMNRLSEPEKEGAALYDLAFLRIYSGKTGFARTCLKNLSSNSDGGNSRLRLYSLESLARLSLMEGRLDEAIKLGNELSASYPAALEGKLLKAELSFAQKDYRQAQTLYKQLAEQTGQAQFSLKAAQCLKLDGDTTGAIKLLNKACDQMPESFQAHFQLAQCYLAAKEFIPARLQFERALEVKPSFEEKRQLFSGFMKVLNAMNDDKALDQWTRTWAQEYPDQAIVHYNRGWFLAKQDEEKNSGKSGSNTKEAIKAYGEALKLDPKMTLARYNLIYLLYKDKQLDRAKLEGEQFLENSSNEEDRQRVRLMLKELAKQK